MRATEFATRAALGQTATAWRGWHDQGRVSGRIVALTKPRYGAWIKDDRTGAVGYFDCTWIDLPALPGTDKEN